MAAFIPKRRSGRHPEACSIVVRLVEPAIDDLKVLNRKDPQIMRWALKKCLLLEKDPEAGEPLKGALIGWRKIVVSDRDWRIVWRVTHDSVAATLWVDVAEVWAVGARADSEVYSEMVTRIAELGNNPSVVPLAEAIERLGRHAGQIAAVPELQVPEMAPAWLIQRLIHTAGMRPEDAHGLSVDDAMTAWTRWASRPQ